MLEAGQDNHFTDPITNLNLTARGYSQMMDIAVDTASRLCGGKIIAIMGGGYGIEGGLPYTNLAVIASLSGLDTSHIREPGNYQLPDTNKYVDVIERIIEQVKEIQAKYHSF